VTTENLIEILKMHSNTPFTLDDYKGVFSQIGVLNLLVCNEFQRRKNQNARLMEMISKLIINMQNLQIQNEPTTINDLRWALDREYTVSELTRALDLMEKLEIIRLNDDGKYVAVMAPRVAVFKLQSMVRAIRLKT